MISEWFPVDCVICSLPPYVVCSQCFDGFELKPRQVRRDALIPGFAVSDYAGAAKDSVHAFKQTGSVALARFMAFCVARGLRTQISDLARRTSGRILLVPAPSRPVSIRIRGYQPAELIAKELARFLRATGIDVAVENCLSVDKSVQDQSLLNASQRAENLRGRVQVSGTAKERLGVGSVVLLDDIVTTGSTLRAMEAALSQIGVVPEFFLSFSETL